MKQNDSGTISHLSPASVAQVKQASLLVAYRVDVGMETATFFVIGEAVPVPGNARIQNFLPSLFCRMFQDKISSAARQMAR